MSVHPHLPIILSSDGYVVTIMQLPSAASYQGVMTGFMKDVTRFAFLKFVTLCHVPLKRILYHFIAIERQSGSCISLATRQSRKMYPSELVIVQKIEENVARVRFPDSASYVG